MFSKRLNYLVGFSKNFTDLNTKSGFEDFFKFSDISDRGINTCSQKKEILEIFAPKYGG